MKKILSTMVAAMVIAPAFAQKPESAPKVLSASGGRYVFGQISDFRRDQYMLDTQTGRLWKLTIRKTKSADGADLEFEFLDHIPYSAESYGATPPPPPMK